MLFNVLTMHVLLQRKRNVSPDTCAAGVTVRDGLALVKLAQQVSHVAPVIEHSQNTFEWKG